MDLTGATLIHWASPGSRLGKAYFGDAVFFGEADFRKVSFTADARFERATFHGAADFDGAHFGGDVRFDEAHFTDAPTFEDAGADTENDRADVWPSDWRLEPAGPTTAGLVRESPASAEPARSPM
mgnify:CR=1 FL=1